MKPSAAEECMALTTDTIDKAKALLDEGAQRFQDYQSELSRVPAFSILMGGKALTQLDPRIISLELTDNRGFEADELTIAIDDSDGLIELPPRGAELSVSLGGRVSRWFTKGFTPLTRSPIQGRRTAGDHRPQRGFSG
jgi:hypothetical protein